MYTVTEKDQKAFTEDYDLLKSQLNLGREILWLTQNDCAEAGPTVEETIALMKDALIAHGRKAYEMPAKIGIHPWDDVFFHAMPAYVPGSKASGCKWIGCYPRNPKQYDLPQTTGLQTMNDITTGVPYAVMDCTWLTAMRTPAVTVLAAAALHPDAKTFGMFGCGVQGINHVRYIVKTLTKLERIYIYDTSPEAMDRLIAVVDGEVTVPIVKAASGEEVCKSCEVMSSATFIVREPMRLAKREWVSKGQTILPCDLNTFWAPEISLEADKYFVDSIEEHELFAGMGYFPAGLPKIVAQTGDILAGLAEGRTSADELIICSNIGMSVCDVVMGRAIYDKAMKLGIGSKLPL